MADSHSAMPSSLAFVHGLGRVGRASWQMQLEQFANAALVTSPERLSATEFWEEFHARARGPWGIVTPPD